MLNMLNTYIVLAHFEGPRDVLNVEAWRGHARNMLDATRRAAREIMRRPGVKRRRHKRVIYLIEKVPAKAA